MPELSLLVCKRLGALCRKTQVVPLHKLRCRQTPENPFLPCGNLHIGVRALTHTLITCASFSKVCSNVALATTRRMQHRDAAGNQLETDMHIVSTVALA